MFMQLGRLWRSSCKRRYCSSGSDSAWPWKEETERLKQGIAHADSSTYGLLIRQCKELEQGRWIHSHILKRGYGQDTFLANLLIKMYATFRCLEEAQAVFYSIRHKNVFSWNIMISAYAQNGHLLQARNLFNQMPRKDAVSWTTMITAYAQSDGRGAEALELFKLMDLNGFQPDRVAFISVLNACSSLMELRQAKLLLEMIAEMELSLDVVLGTMIVGMYGKCGRVEEAREAFESMAERNVVSWAVMLEALVENGHLLEARKAFEKMAHWNSIVWSIMVTAYARVDIHEAESLLEKMAYRNVSAWTVVISVNAHSGDLRKALRLFQLMDQDGVFPDKITLVNLLDGCAKCSALTEGKLIEHGIREAKEFMQDEKIATNLINLHGKCGSLEHASSLFYTVYLHSSVILWTSMMAAHAQNGQGAEAIELYHCMNLYGIEPTRITFTIVLFVCSHGGSLRKGWEYFLEMQADHGLTPDCDNFGSMVDLLGRSAKLKEAFELMDTMPFEPDYVSWTTLLGASRLFGESVWGAQAAGQLIGSKTEDSAPYVLLASVCRQ